MTIKIPLPKYDAEIVEMHSSIGEKRGICFASVLGASTFIKQTF